MDEDMRWVCPYCHSNNMPESPVCFRCRNPRREAPTPGRQRQLAWQGVRTPVMLMGSAVALVLFLLFGGIWLRGHEPPLGNSVLGSAAPRVLGPGVPVTGAAGWTESPTDQEQPYLRIHNETASEADTIFDGDSGARYTLHIGPDTSGLSLVPGTYHYWLYADYYRMHGVPDSEGTLTCRRFRLYELGMYDNGNGPTAGRHFGDD